MWWKLLALLGLGSPLLWWAWREIETHPDVVRPRDTLPAPETMARRRGEQQALLRELARAGLDDDLARGVLSASLDREPFAVERSEPNRQLAEAMKKHQAAIEQVRCFAADIVTLEEQRGNGPACKQADYLAWLEKRRKEIAAIHVRLSEPLRKFGTVVTEVIDKLKTRQPRKLHEIRTDLNELQRELESSLTELSELAKGCTGFPVLHRELEQKMREGAACRQLLKAVFEGQRLRLKDEPDPREVLGLMKRLASLVEDGKTSPLGELVRQQARLFAQEYLDSTMPEDGKILFYPRGRIAGDPFDIVKRDDVIIVWARGGQIELSKSKEYSEMTPPPKEKVQYYLHKVDRSQGDAIAPSPRNKAARYYNARRPGLRMDETSLRAFVKDCPVMWRDESEKPGELQRIDHLLGAMKQYPALFALKP